jgi:hypothetical protein
VNGTAVDVFVDAGIEAHDRGVLPDALAELSIRLDLVGAGDLLDVLMATCWGPDRDDCPHCAIPVRYQRPKGGAL